MIPYSEGYDIHIFRMQVHASQDVIAHKLSFTDLVSFFHGSLQNSMFYQKSVKYFICYQEEKEKGEENPICP